MMAAMPMTMNGTNTNLCATLKYLRPPAASAHSMRMTTNATTVPPSAVPSHEAALSSPNAVQMGIRPRVLMTNAPVTGNTSQATTWDPHGMTNPTIRATVRVS